MAERIPPETIDRIIDHLHDNPATLATFRRVCRNWVPRARLHFFHTLTLTDAEACPRIIKSYNHLQQYVHEICMRPKPSKRLTSGDLLKPSIFQPLFTCFRSAHSLHIMNMPLLTGSARWLINLDTQPSFLSIQELFISDDNSDKYGIPFVDVVGLCSLFPALSSLHLKSTDLRASDALTAPSFSTQEISLVVLESLVLEGNTSCSSEQLELIRRTSVRDKLKSLVLLDVVTENAKNVFTLVHEFGSELEYLGLDLASIEVCCKDEGDDFTYWSALGLPSFAALRNIHLVVNGGDALPSMSSLFHPAFFGQDDTEKVSSWRSAACILSQLPHSVRRITFAIHPRDGKRPSTEREAESQLENCQWDLMAQTFEALAELEVVRFVYEGTRNSRRRDVDLCQLPVSMKRRIQLEFPALHRARKLQFL